MRVARDRLAGLCFLRGLSAASQLPQQGSRPKFSAPNQRFLQGFAQWVCENIRLESRRGQALTDPHSPVLALIIFPALRT